MGISGYDKTAANNTTIPKDGGGTHAISNSMDTVTLDDVFRQIMADFANFASWDVKTAAYTAVAYDTVQADTVTTAAFTLTLPASPTAGQWVKVVAASTWASNNLTIGRNGSTIRGAGSDLTLSDGLGAQYAFHYDGSTWQYTSSADLSAYQLAPSEGAFVDGDKTKLDYITATGAINLDNIEDNADVTDEANVTDALDGAALTAATVATGDKVLIQDADDSDVLKTVTAQSIADLAAGGAWEFISTATASSSSELVFTGLDSADYQAYKFVIEHLVPSSASQWFYVRMSDDGGSTWKSSGYKYAGWGVFATGGTDVQSNNSGGQINLIDSQQMNTSSSGGVCGVVRSSARPVWCSLKPGGVLKRRMSSSARPVSSFLFIKSC